MKSLLALFLLLPLYSYADWKVVDRSDWPVSDGKFAASELRVTNGDGEAEVNLVYFTVADVRFEVIANTDGQIRGLKELIETRGGFAGINGGYFESNLAPVGLLISNGRVVHGLQKAKLLSGIFYVRNGRPSLARIPEFPRNKRDSTSHPMRSFFSGRRPGGERIGQSARRSTNIYLYLHSGDVGLRHLPRGHFGRDGRSPRTGDSGSRPAHQPRIEF